MSDNFNVKRYKKEAGFLKLNTEDKNILTAKMYQARDNMKNNNTEKAKKKKIWLKPAAAALAAVILATGAWIGFGNTQPKNSFSIVADAASIYSGDADITNGYSEGAMAGAFMETDTETLRKDGFRDYFAEYFPENFVIKGTNIKSYKITSAKKGIYFDLFPVEKNRDFIDKKKALADFKDKDSINNSQYTRKEFEKYAPFLNWVCDGYSHDNPNTPDGTEQVVLPDKYLFLVLESNHSDPDIAKWITQMEGLKVNEKKDYKKYSELEKKIQKKTLSKAKIKVEVTYTDNSIETKSIKPIYKGHKDISFSVK